MRQVIAYEQGRAIWSENVPASPVVPASRGGALVTGESGSVERQRLAERRHQARKKAGA